VGRQARYSPEGRHYLWFVPARLLSISSPYTCSSAISPWQTKAAPNMFREYLFNGYRRMAGEFKFWAIPFGVGMQHPCFMLGVSQPLFYRLCYLRMGQELRPLPEQQGRSYRVGSSAPLEHSRFMEIAITYGFSFSLFVPSSP